MRRQRQLFGYYFLHSDFAYTRLTHSCWLFQLHPPYIMNTLFVILWITNRAHVILQPLCDQITIVLSFVVKFFRCATFFNRVLLFHYLTNPVAIGLIDSVEALSTSLFFCSGGFKILPCSSFLYSPICQHVLCKNSML